MRQRLVPIFLLFLVCAAGALAGPAHPPGPTAGSYNCIVAGDFTGDGKISSGGDGTTITFTLQVRDKVGNRGELRATVSIAKNRFAGDGTVMGYPMKIQGRLDPADQGGRDQLRGQRLVATFSDDSKRHGRITGSPRLRSSNGDSGPGGGRGDDE